MDTNNKNKTTDEILAEALSTPIAPAVESVNLMNSQNEVVATIPTPAPTPKLQAIVATPANPKTAHLIQVNELYEKRTVATEQFTLNGKTITINMGGDYDALVKAIGMALNLILDSGDNYIFSPNQRIIMDLVFVRHITNINLEFLTLPEIRISQLIETYDILKPLINYIMDKMSPANEGSEQLANYYGWYTHHLTTSIKNAQEYAHSAKGIVDALSNHNIKNQKEMTEQITETNSDKLNTIIDFMKQAQGGSDTSK